MEQALNSILVVSEHISQRVRTQKITPAQAMGDIMTALLMKMSPEEQMGVEKKLNDTVGKLNERTRNEVLAWRSPYEPKTETVMLTLKFEGEHKVPAQFTLLGDHVIMTIDGWAIARQNGERDIIRLELPKQYHTMNDSIWPIFVYNGDDFLKGSVTNGAIIAIYANPNGNNPFYQNPFYNFKNSGKVGFPKFTITYSL